MGSCDPRQTGSGFDCSASLQLGAKARPDRPEGLCDRLSERHSFEIGAQVRDISNPGYFKADLDTFGGNSGSGVYDQATKKLVGVLVKGDTDYKEDPAKQCMIAHVCPRYSDCLGEDVTRVSVVTALQ